MAGYKINSKKSAALILKIWWKCLAKNRETTSFRITDNNLKHFDATQTKHLTSWYGKNLKFLKKDIEEAIRKWRDYPWSWTMYWNSKNKKKENQEIDILPKEMFSFIAIHIKNSITCFKTLKEELTTSYG